MCRKEDYKNKLTDLLKSLPDSYDDIVIGTNIIAKRTGKYKQIIDFLEHEKPTCSELVCFLDDEIDPV